MHCFPHLQMYDYLKIEGATFLGHRQVTLHKWESQNWKQRTKWLCLERQCMKWSDLEQNWRGIFHSLNIQGATFVGHRYIYIYMSHPTPLNEHWDQNRTAMHCHCGMQMVNVWFWPTSPDLLWPSDCWPLCPILPTWDWLWFVGLVWLAFSKPI